MAQAMQGSWQQAEPVCESQRLKIRRMSLDDAAFLARQLNEPSWMQFIGDRGVRDVVDARRYIEDRIFGQYRTLGYGMNVVQLKTTGEPVGVCGLVKRDTLAFPDLGFALLEAHWGRGYALEAAAAVARHAQQALGFATLLAITTPTNARSQGLLLKLGFEREPASYSLPDGERLMLFALRQPLPA